MIKIQKITFAISPDVVAMLPTPKNATSRAATTKAQAEASIEMPRTLDAPERRL
jgi:hypothetical protein